jgi:hypothetical protein
MHFDASDFCFELQLLWNTFFFNYYLLPLYAIFYRKQRSGIEIIIVIIQEMF